MFLHVHPDLPAVWLFVAVGTAFIFVAVWTLIVQKRNWK